MPGCSVNAGLGYPDGAPAESMQMRRIFTADQLLGPVPGLPATLASGEPEAGDAMAGKRPGRSVPLIAHRLSSHLLDQS